MAFCEYLDPAVTDIAVEGLNGMELGDKQLKVQRASIGVTQAAGLEMGVNAMSMLAGTTSTDLDEGRVLQLLNMVTAEELIDNEDYQGACEASPAHRPYELTKCRNMRRRQGRVRQVWRGTGDENSETQWGQPAVKRRRQDLR